jgi:hypothetical protein
LVEFKFHHFDGAIRELTAQALAALAPSCPDYMAFEVAPRLVKHTASMDLNTRHGALLSLGHVLRALTCQVAVHQRVAVERLVSVELRVELSSVVLARLFEPRYLRGSTGEAMRIVVCLFVKLLVQARLHVHFPQLFFTQSESKEDLKEGMDKKKSAGWIGECEEFLAASIEYNKESVQTAAVDALRHLAELKYPPSSFTNQLHPDKVKILFLKNVLPYHLAFSQKMNLK